MNYCSIEDAWGSSNCASKQFKEYMTNVSSTNDKPNINLEQKIEIEKVYEIEPKKEVIKKSKKDKVITYDFDNRLDELNNCDSFIIHVRNCRKCYNRMKNQFKPQLIENFQGIIEDNRDTIVLILIGISILLFFNLINNITKN
jgi:hypothetical protein